MTMPTFEPVAFFPQNISLGIQANVNQPRGTKLFTESQLQQVYAAGLRDAVPEGWTAIHLKTGNEYQVIGEAIDVTNMHCNQLIVIYQRDGKTFVREAEGFQ